MANHLSACLTVYIHKNDSICACTQRSATVTTKNTYINICNTQRVKMQKLLTLWVEVKATKTHC